MIEPPPQVRRPREPVVEPYPVTSRGPGGGVVTGRPEVFDPALKHFRVGLLPDEPRFKTAEELAAWRALQRHVMSHVLSSIADSPAAPHLVLRGSALMCAWFPEAARPPKDLDFVVIPETLSISEPRATELLRAVADAVTSRPCEGVELRRDEVARDEIWTYDRVPGTRLVFRWTTPGMPWGATQLDFVFGERMPAPHELLDVALSSAPAARLQTAPKDLSLAWKLLWLCSDMHPRGKDLYDAMLLAEATTLKLPLLDTVFEIANATRPAREELIDIREKLEWVGFEEPLESTVDDWKRRLNARLLDL